jgi:hypothetical protein
VKLACRQSDVIVTVKTMYIIWSRHKKGSIRDPQLRKKKNIILYVSVYRYIVWRRFVLTVTFVSDDDISLVH